MSGSRVAWLLAFAVVLIAFAVWVASRRHLEHSMMAGDLVLPHLQQNVNTITSVRLAKAGDVHTTLQKSGGGWRVAEREWPADVGKVRKLLLDLGALNIVEEKTRLPANYAALGVEDVAAPKATGTRIDVTAPGTTWAIIVGKSSSAKSGFVRLASAPQTLLAAPLISVDADPKTWLDQALIDLDAKRVREVQERPAQGAAFAATREKPEGSFAVAPLPKGRQLTSPAAAEPIAGALRTLTLDDVRKGGRPAADTPVSHALFRTFDGLEVDVSGRKDGTRPLISLSARSSAQGTAAEAQKLNARLEGWEFEIADYKYSAIFTSLEDLLQKPPEPVKKPAAAHQKAAAPAAAKPTAATPAPDAAASAPAPAPAPAK